MSQQNLEFSCLLIHLKLLVYPPLIRIQPKALFRHQTGMIVQSHHLFRKSTAGTTSPKTEISISQKNIDHCYATAHFLKERMVGVTNRQDLGWN